jgi:hypothetical protein
MDTYLRKIIEETFASKSQQRFFYAKAGDKSKSPKERKKWGKWAKEFSSKTDFKKIPDKIEDDIDEVVDEFGNISKKKIPLTKDSKGGSKKTTDQVVRTAGGSMGIHGVHGTHTSLRYWAESDLTKGLGYHDTLGQDASMKDAEEYFKNELEMDDRETEDRLSSYGYDKKLKGDKVRLIENPSKFIEDYVESILNKKTDNNDLLKSDQYEDIEKEIDSLTKKQIMALKKNINNNSIPLSQVIKLLKNKDE